MSNVLGSDTKGKIKTMNKIFWGKTTQELKKLNYGKPKSNKVFMFCGDKEMDGRTTKMKNVKIIKNTGHKFTKNYKKAVLEALELK